MIVVGETREDKGGGGRNKGEFKNITRQTKQDKAITRQDKTRQDKTRQDKTITR